MQTARFEYLFQQYLRKSYTEAEREEFFALLQQPGYQALLDKLSGEYDVPANQAPPVDEQAAEEILAAILTVSRPAPKPAGRVHFLRKWGWAAAAILLITTGAYLLSVQRKNTTVSTPGTSKLADIAPGKQGAILTLADGSQVVLDSLANGIVAKQNGAQVVLKNGQLSYDALGEATAEITYNTITAPRGRQFQLVLPDGSRVWLNAASSLTYPTAFSGSERSVQISGEAYFEIAKDAQHPFRVNIDNETGIQVLGTRFNVHAYPEETSIKTTLLEGSVRMISGKQQALLAPGQAAQTSRGASQQPIKIIDNADPGKALAWKNGLFDFEDTSLEEVMRHLARWYDIEIVYEAGIPPIVFGGKMSRDMMLSDLLRALDDSEVHFRTNGRRLIVMP
ncbi:MAG TPA: FecR domain-containing protein [Chitinophaga sp.]